MAKKNENLLASKEEIKAYLGDITDYMFAKYIKIGMPARYEDKRWLAHACNLDEFFKIYTRVSMRKKLNEIPENTG